MLTFEEAGRCLDEAAEKLPRAVFDGLNGGVNLLPDKRVDAEGFLLLGMYIVDEMGRRVEIYYGSFAALYAESGDDEVRAELDKTLRHELTHHVEGLAGDRSLEKWDERQRLEMLAEEAPPLQAESVLFAGSDPSLPPLCDALFGRICAENALAVRHGCAVFGAAGSADLKCAAAAADQGLTLCEAPALTAELLRQYEAILTMTLAEANALAERFPEADEKILALGRTDYAVPRPGLKMLWAGLLRRLDEELFSLAEELTEEAQDD